MKGVSITHGLRLFLKRVVIGSPEQTAIKKGGCGGPTKSILSQEKKYENWERARENIYHYYLGEEGRFGNLSKNGPRPCTYMKYEWSLIWFFFLNSRKETWHIWTGSLRKTQTVEKLQVNITRILHRRAEIYLRVLRNMSHEWAQQP